MQETYNCKKPVVDKLIYELVFLYGETFYKLSAGKAMAKVKVGSADRFLKTVKQYTFIKNSRQKSCVSSQIRLSFITVSG